MTEKTQKTVTLREVAALAGVNMATVSRALSGKGYVSEKTREAALNAARELNFQPNLHARRLVQGRSHNTVALLPTIDLGVLTKQAFFIQHRLDEMGFEVETHNVPQFFHHSEERQVALVNKVRQQRPGAIIVGTPLVPDAVQELQLFMQEGGAVIGYLGAMRLECDQVPLDFMHRTHLATRHLLELGHRDIGFCSHGQVQQESPDIAGFSQAMEEFGAPIRQEWLFGGGNYEEGGLRMAEAFLRWPEKPTGMCIINDISASAFVTALHRNGVNVPNDVSVVGFDDGLAARAALVPLTSVSYPLEAIGRQVVEFTHSRLNSYSGPPRTVVVRGELTHRSSTAPPTVRMSTNPSSSPLPLLMPATKTPVSKSGKAKTNGSRLPD